ncbi:NAD(P)H-hydrate epimerase [Herbiconiux sp. VKM Ac-1786]|uniref:NAD(P)H-hydrate epimerase n=1 Tax=Herbiconiux sp. VKM Ac-1786 TaxID=2783824 RepID=UPI00188D84F4|nr:NAD(P)H-hydrate epimerase [Herbiconiux sp. VKM Ac-1786]MBF4573106.1 NAD(P)H-hydrate epimerase [Herbiconiux sp. VKM Ac-1786]
MRTGYTAQAVRDAERPHLEAGEPLMERASHALAQEIVEQLGALPPPPGGRPWRVVLLVGSGSNGGDALFAGAELAGGTGAAGGTGIVVEAIRVGTRVHEGGRAAAEAAGVGVRSREETEAARVAVQGDVVVDGILGTGTAAAPALRGAAREVVAGILNRIAAGDGAPLIVAVDLPSGVDPDTGAVADEVVLPADVTVTFGGIKAGLLQGPGAQLAGEVVLAEIGIEAELAATEPAIVVP